MADNLFDTWDPEPSSETSDTLNTSNRIPKKIKVEIRGNHSIVLGETVEISPLDLKIRITDDRFLTREILASPIHCKEKIEQELAYGLGVHFPELDVTYTGRIAPQGQPESAAEDPTMFTCTLDREMESATFLMMKKLNEQSKELEEIKARKAELNQEAQAGNAPGDGFNLDLGSGASDLDNFFDRIESTPPSGGSVKTTSPSEPAQTGEVYRVEVVGEYKTFKGKAYELSANNILIHIANSELRVPDGPGRSVFINKVITDHFIKGMAIRFLGTDFSMQADPVGLSEITIKGEQLTVIDCRFKKSLSLDDLASLEGAEQVAGAEPKDPGAFKAPSPQGAAKAPGPFGAVQEPSTPDITQPAAGPSAGPSGDAWPPFSSQAPQTAGPAGNTQASLTPDASREKGSAGDAWPPFSSEATETAATVENVPSPATPEAPQPADPVGVERPPINPEITRASEPAGTVQGSEPTSVAPAAEPVSVPQTPPPSVAPMTTTTPDHLPAAPPAAAMPVDAPPATGMPVGEPPAATMPVGEPPAATMPVGEPPAATMPVGEPPAATMPVGEPPAATMPVAAPPASAPAVAATAPSPAAATSPAPDTEKIREFLKQAVEKGVTDLHIRAGHPPHIRVSGDLVDLGTGPVSPELCRSMALGLMTPDEAARFEQEKDLELGFHLEGLGHFRVSVFLEQDSTGLAVRCLQRQIPTIESLGMHQLASKMCEKTHGLVLVTGSAGSGKTTTLAALVNQINQTRPCHIITLEDPIEYRHQDHKAQITQREIGRDALDFSRALRRALHQDPDVILVGEMGGPETITLALNAAETGRLVLAALNAPTAAQALARAIEGFPPDRQGEIRTRLAEALEGILAQELVPKEGGQGLKLVQEALLTDHAVCACIRENKLLQITEALRKSLDENGQDGESAKVTQSANATESAQTAEDIKAAQAVQSKPDAKPALTIEDLKALKAAQTSHASPTGPPSQTGQDSGASPTAHSPSVLQPSQTGEDTQTSSPQSALPLQPEQDAQPPQKAPDGSGAPSQSDREKEKPGP